MSNERLRIVEVNTGLKKAKKRNANPITKRTKAKAHFDHLWQTDKELFNPFNSCLGKERIKRTWALIEEFISLKKNMYAADLGVGFGILTLKLIAKNVSVDAVDVSKIPLKMLINEEIKDLRLFEEYVPHTTLESEFYDLVLATDLIAYLNKAEYRLFFSEVARLVKKEGYVVISTPIDIYSDGALQHFADLAESEFHIEKWLFSYHSYFLRLLSFFEAPANFVKANQNDEFYQKQLKKRFSINKFLFKINCSKPAYFFWSFIKLFTNPILKLLNKSQFLMLKLEKLCRFFSNETGISHAIFIGKRRQLFEQKDQKDVPLERKGKQQVWE